MHCQPEKREPGLRARVIGDIVSGASRVRRPNYYGISPSGSVRGGR